MNLWSFDGRSQLRHSNDFGRWRKKSAKKLEPTRTMTAVVLSHMFSKMQAQLLKRSPSPVRMKLSADLPTVVELSVGLSDVSLTFLTTGLDIQLR